MNDYLIFGASGLTGNNFLKEVKDTGRSYHLFVRSLIEDEDADNQTIFSQDCIKELPRSKNLIICLGYPLAFQELIWMNGGSGNAEDRQINRKRWAGWAKSFQENVGILKS